MPSAYTAPVESGEIKDLNGFAWRCARAFASLIRMRDCSLDASVPLEVVPDTRRMEEQLALNQSEVLRLRGLSKPEIQARIDAEHADAVSYYWAAKKKRAAVLTRYAAMRLEVAAWSPPTPDHVGLKDFMLAQLRESEDFDCREPEQVRAKPSPEAWLADQLEYLERQIHFREERISAERTGCFRATVWLQALRASVGDPPCKVPAGK